MTRHLPNDMPCHADRFQVQSTARDRHDDDNMNCRIHASPPDTIDGYRQRTRSPTHSISVCRSLVRYIWSKYKFHREITANPGLPFSQSTREQTRFTDILFTKNIRIFAITTRVCIGLIRQTCLSCVCVWM